MIGSPWPFPGIWICWVTGLIKRKQREVTSLQGYWEHACSLSEHVLLGVIATGWKPQRPLREELEPPPVPAGLPGSSQHCCTHSSQPPEKWALHVNQPASSWCKGLEPLLRAPAYMQEQEQDKCLLLFQVSKCWSGLWPRTDNPKQNSRRPGPAPVERDIPNH